MVVCREDDSGHEVVPAKATRHVKVFVHSFGYARGSVRSIKNASGKYPIHPNYLIDARSLRPVKKSSVYKGKRLSALDGRYVEVQQFVDKLGDLRRLVHSEAECIASKINEWNNWEFINVAIGSKWGRHRAVAVQTAIISVLREKLAEYGISATFKVTYFGFLPEPMVVKPTGRPKSTCDE